MGLSGVGSFTSVMPYDYDLVIQQAAATDFIVYMAFIRAKDSPWHGALTNDMILTELLIRALKYARQRGLYCILLRMSTPFLGDVPSIVGLGGTSVAG